MDENRPSRSMHVSSLPGSFGGLFQSLCERNSLISVCYAENIGPSSATKKSQNPCVFQQFMCRFLDLEIDNGDQWATILQNCV